MINKIIIVNVAVFVLVSSIWFLGLITHSENISIAFREIENLLSVSSEPMVTIKQPWSILTYMFMHRGIMHLLFNMLMLFWFGRIIGDFLGDHRVLPLYLMGGIVGALFMILIAAVFPIAVLQNVMMVGASASVMALAAAAATLTPDYRMRLILLGEVPIRYIVIGLIVIDFLQIVSMNNVGGYLAHLGGVLFGWIYIRMMQEGRDLTHPLQSFFSKISKVTVFPIENSKNPVRKRVFQMQQSTYNFMDSNNEKPEMDHEERLNTILDKIKNHGYQSLKDDEKSFLFEASKK